MLDEDSACDALFLFLLPCNKQPICEVSNLQIILHVLIVILANVLYLDLKKMAVLITDALLECEK